MKNTIQHIQTFSREQKEVNREIFDLNKSITEAISLLHEHYRNRGIEIILELAEEDIPLYGNPYKLEQVLMNLASNACDALAEGGEINIKTERNKKTASIKVKDNGHGISEDILDQVIQPFFTTKQPGEGTGLGLSISYGIIKDMEGELELRNNEGKGVTAIVTLPVYEGKL
jgi:signal transduction histidine kinase